MFLDDYIKNNDIKSGSYRSGYLPLLMAFNKNSQSTPCRMVQCPNRQAVCKPSKNTWCTVKVQQKVNPNC